MKIEVIEPDSYDGEGRVKSYFVVTEMNVKPDRLTELLFPDYAGGVARQVTKIVVKTDLIQVFLS